VPSKHRLYYEHRYVMLYSISEADIISRVLNI